jgi:hypothetical protein
MEGLRMRRRSMFGGLTAAAGVCALITGLALLDERVRLQIARTMRGKAPTDELATIGERASDLMAIAMQAIQDQSVEHAALVVFSAAALVLVFFMTRT